MRLIERLKRLASAFAADRPVEEPTAIYRGGITLDDDNPLAKAITQAMAKSGRTGAGLVAIDKNTPEGRAITEMLAGRSLMHESSPVTDARDMVDAARAVLGGDQTGDHIAWSVWQNERRIILDMVPLGWSACRFFNRVGLDAGAGVFGVVKGEFGIWRQPFAICDYTSGEHEQDQTILSCLSHLPTGLGIGCFVDGQTAAAAADLALALDWSHMPQADPGDEVSRALWRDRQGELYKMWAFHGIAKEEERHAHDLTDPYQTTIGILARSEENLTAGKPEKVS